MHAATDLAACAAYDGAVAAAAATGCPVMVVSGASDKMTPAPASQSVLKALADGEVLVGQVTLPIGHMMMTEDPDAIRRVLLEAVFGHH